MDTEGVSCYTDFRMLEAVQKHKLRAGLEAPPPNRLAEYMGQGGAYMGGTPAHGLCDQMHQCTGKSGYKAGSPTHKLQKQMGQ